ncbi:hypothetical protein [Streptomyces erythrochromogenes]|uniref:hypothetical protein n=1 Tax=Streptomyces erythrochromogenes TaxID=285574 RepID=UPI0036AF143D
MWLARLQHTGKNGDGDDVPMPPVVFEGVQLENRVDNNGDGSPPFLRWRVAKVNTESGAVKKLYVTDWFHKHRVDQVRDGNPTPSPRPRGRTTSTWTLRPGPTTTSRSRRGESTRTWSQWRGYGHVRTLVAAPDKRFQVDSVFFRGMDGGKAPHSRRQAVGQDQGIRRR